MQLFYAPDITPPIYTLNEEESKHCIKVLRLGVGDTLHVTDGKGNMHLCRVMTADARHCTIEIVSTEEEFEKMPYELSVKFIWDGYTFKMYAQTGLMKSVAPNEWSLITEGYNIYDRYANSDTMAQYKDTLFELDKECQFGISCRLDTPSDHQTVNSPTFSNIWFNIYDKPAA